MSVHTLRNFMCAVVAAASLTLGTSARATHYGVAFDPPFSVEGLMVINVDPTCLTLFPMDNACAFDVLSVHFGDGAGNIWEIGAPQLGIGLAVRVDAADMLTGVEVDIFNLQPVGIDSPCEETHLSFALNGAVAFTCIGNSDADAEGRVTSITQIPEPGTLAMLGLGFGAAVVARRRKRA